MLRANSFLPFLALTLILSLLSGCCIGGRYNTWEERTEAQNKLFPVKELNIIYRDYGNANAPLTILFVHGLGTSKSIWRDLAQSLKFDYRVILIDLLGHGDSSKPENYTYSISEQAGILRKFIKNKNLRNLIIVGISYGGAITLEAVLPLFYCKELNPVRGLVLLAPTAFYFEPPKYLSMLKASCVRYILRFFDFILPDSCLAAFIANRALKKMFWNDELIQPELYAELSRIYKDPKARKALKKAGLKIFQELEVRKYLDKRYSPIDCPVLLAWGKYDEFVPRGVMCKLCKNLPKPHPFIINYCGHALELECPENINMKIINFIEKIRGIKPMEDTSIDRCAVYCVDDKTR